MGCWSQDKQSCLGHQGLLLGLQEPSCWGQAARCTSILLASFFPCQVLTLDNWSFCLFPNFQTQADTPEMLAHGGGAGETHLGFMPYPLCWRFWVVSGEGNLPCCCLQDWCKGTSAILMVKKRLLSSLHNRQLQKLPSWRTIIQKWY